MSKLTGRQKCYRKRERNLKKLGFESYKEYLKSDLWKSIRCLILFERNYTCHFCKGKATEVHHLRYTINTLSMVNKHFRGGLTATCRNCHQKISEYAKDNQIQEEEAFRLFNMNKNRGLSIYK